MCRCRPGSQDRAAGAKGQHEGAGRQREQVSLGGTRPFTRPERLPVYYLPPFPV